MIVCKQKTYDEYTRCCQWQGSHTPKKQSYFEYLDAIPSTLQKKTSSFSTALAPVCIEFCKKCYHEDIINDLVALQFCYKNRKRFLFEKEIIFHKNAMQ